MSGETKFGGDLGYDSVQIRSGSSSSVVNVDRTMGGREEPIYTAQGRWSLYLLRAQIHSFCQHQVSGGMGEGALGRFWRRVSVKIM